MHPIEYLEPPRWRQRLLGAVFDSRPADLFRGLVGHECRLLPRDDLDRPRHHLG